MKTIVTAIKTALRNATALNFVRDNDIFLSPTVNYLPTTASRYAISIVPGPERRQEKMGNILNSKPVVRVVLWVTLLGDEESVVGNSGNPGILDFTETVDGVLDENLLGITGLENAFCSELSEPRVFGSKEQHGRFILQRILQYDYEREVNR